MNGPGLAKTRPDEISMRWKPFTYTAPLLLECLRPLRSTAPEHLEQQAIVNAIFAVYLVNMGRFNDDRVRISSHLSDEQIARAWSKPFNFWFLTNDRKRTLHYRRFDGTRREVWPQLEVALRTLVPSLPAQINPMHDFKHPALQEPGIRAFLLSVTLLLMVVTRRQRHPTS